MAYFLAVYTMKPESLAGFYARSKAEQDAIDAEGLPKWEAWEQRNAQALVNRGGMVGKTLRVSKAGIAPASNDFCGYVVVEAETIEAAADLFRDHPHFSVFPGDTVDLMPFLAGPDLENKPAR
ncbi:hypothetical protein [Devosia sp. 63-57]|uniref:hypothetical protein n=1 Tax=Devosia sp. 63-57 TaxID=1895751 RepID=UPI00086F15BF|nr:hypothetical protein [Devosia sp. 63-57]ODT50170.1 MAG: hypothetical protein ABS74_04410 [Pelagibacterium sp. SCN 63-126]ODU87365.1 MAG: hypothetical protein ABT14_05145 [Pelagibacterium sp. SCN 63-17]OJX44913.1 MAG: hypothetical protein BGO80_03410 [Devosia sp. 63-57]